MHWIVLLLLGAALACYVWPGPRPSAAEIYANVEPASVQALTAFRQSHPPMAIETDGARWEFIAAGQGEETIVFLHGLAGDATMWWQQMADLKTQYRTIAVTYPPVNTLAEMERGILAVLDAQGVSEFSVVGSSTGGYIAQYLAARHPQRIRRMVLGNTFAPNDLIAGKSGILATLLTYSPQWLVMQTMRQNYQKGAYPASGGHALTLAMLNEMTYGRMSRAQLASRYRCIVEKFDAPRPKMPVMILESDNDPLVELALRDQLKASYPTATVRRFADAGHFPYLNHAQTYSNWLLEFMQAK